MTQEGSKVEVEEVPKPEEETILSDLTVKEFLLWVLRRRSRFRITGNSMRPLLKPKEEVLINPKAYQAQAPQVGDLVVAFHPQRPSLKIVKRITQIKKSRSHNPSDSSQPILESNRYFLLGENLDESTDSRNFGWVEGHLLQGKITSRFG